MVAPTDHIHAAYDQYQKDQSPENLRAVVGHLKPVIDYSLNSINALDDPHLQNEAKIITAQAVQKYDPSRGAHLKTWASNQLMQMRRIRRQSQAPLRVPDGIQLDAVKIFQAKQEFQDKHDREPDAGELADFAKMPIRRIRDVNRKFRLTPSQASFGGDSAAENETDHTDEALGYVHNDSDHIDRRIIEMKTGFDGTTPMLPKDIAQALKLTPSQLSRRSKRITLRLQDLTRGLENM